MSSQSDVLKKRVADTHLPWLTRCVCEDMNNGYHVNELLWSYNNGKCYSGTMSVNSLLNIENTIRTRQQREIKKWIAAKMIAWIDPSWILVTRSLQERMKRRVSKMSHSIRYLGKVSIFFYCELWKASMRWWKKNWMKMFAPGCVSLYRATHDDVNAHMSRKCGLALSNEPCLVSNVAYKGGGRFDSWLIMWNEPVRGG